MRQELYLLATDKIDGIIPKILKVILFLLSWIYGVCVRTILFCYKKNILRQERLGCKVISVGNITLGGTGKTPLIEFLIKYLSQKGYKVGVLAHGYKRDVRIKTDSSYKSIGDEPYMLKLNNPKIPVDIGKDRINIGREMMNKYGLDVVLLDDGFQYWGLKRDLDIVTIDASFPFGNRHLVPRGILREPLSSLKRVDILMITKADAQNINLDEIRGSLKKINPSALIVESVYNPLYFYDINQIKLKENRQNIPLSKIDDKNICLVCSIANPEYFEQMIKNMGLNPALKFYFMDHQEYTQSDLDVIFNLCSEKNLRTIITTEKDAVKLKELNIVAKSDYQILVLKIEFTITKNETEFFDRLSIVCKH